MHREAALAWFAACYDRITAPAERAVLGPLRARLLGGLAGRVLEIGAGTGANLPYYDPRVSLVATEPDPAMRRRIPGGVEVRDAPAEALPFADGAFDAVVGTLVLCSVEDPARALDEVARVLRPGGTYVFVEHIAGEGWRRALQGALDPAWRRLAGGCRLVRDPLPLIRARFARVDDAVIWPPGFPPFLAPLRAGSAVRA